MRSRIALLGLLAAVAAGVSPGEAVAQVTLADDIILAAQGKANAERKRRSSLGQAPGTGASPYRHSPGSDDIDFGAHSGRRPAPLPQLVRLRANPTAFRPPPQEPAPPGHGLAPAIERLHLPTSEAMAAESSVDAFDDDGPPDGLTLDAAIERLVRSNRDLRTKSFEIPQAEADILTAGLRENPLLFYSSGSIPYGSYSRARPGDVEHGISLVLPIDYTGKRRARVALAVRERCILEAQYRNAVRLAIDDLYTAYVDALAARQAIHVAEEGLRLVDELLRHHPAGAPRTVDEQEAVDDLDIARDIAAMSAGDTRVRYGKARRRLGHLLDLSEPEAEALELRGTIRAAIPRLPPVDELICLAIAHRPDLAAYRAGVDRAGADLARQKTERLSDAYLLYTPFEYFDRSQSRELSSSTWGVGAFVSIPLFDRNQGNLRRARVNIDQARNEAAVIRDQVAAEVRQAVVDLDHTRGDVDRLEGVILPAIRRKRDKARARLRAGQIGPDDFLGVQRETSELVRYYRDTLTRHRRNMLKVNTAVGLRLVP